MRAARVAPASASGSRRGPAASSTRSANIRSTRASAQRSTVKSATSFSSASASSTRSASKPSVFTSRRFASSDAANTIGFIGLGQMGARMAANLHKAGRKLVILDVLHQTCVDWVKNREGVQIAKTPKELAQSAKTIITMLPSSPHVSDVYGNAVTGIFSGMQSGSLLIDTSTINPQTARDVAKAAEEKGSRMIDAPVSGGVGGAEAGTLTFMVGGTDGAFNDAKPILQLMGKNIVHCGGPGNGQVVKVCNNLVLGISMVGVSEAMNLGVKLGMDPKVLAGIFNTSSARCWSSDTYNPVPGVLPNVPSSRGYSGGFGVDLMAKDLSLAISAAHGVKAPLPLGAQALQMYNLISSNGYSNLDFSSVYKFFNEDSSKKSSEKEQQDPKKTIAH